MEIDPRQRKAAFNQIRKVLLESWDPLDVQDLPDAFDEYDTYVPQIFALLAQGAKEAQLIAYLKDVETRLMGLDEPADDDLQPVARELLAVKAVSVGRT